jgi:hypothetical protein
MNRKWLLAGLAGAAVAAGAAWALLPSRSPAGPSGPAPDSPPAARAEQLPVSRVVLFSSGVGHFLREGTVEGDARVDLAFPVADVNDLLKSLVLLDKDGGHASAVSYDSSAPLEHTLKSFAVDLTANPSYAQLLQQARGEKVEISLSQAAGGQPATLTGTVIGTERQKQPTGKEPVEVDVLNLWCADGMRAVRLADVQRIRFLNPALDSEFKKALEALAQSHDAQKKAVSLLFSGKGKRRVSVGYVVESPIWKTTYRLVLDKEDKPYLQGWAVVENPSDEDWRDVKMALVSGRPVSFRMDLYQPLYVPRPLVVPELFASLRPPAYTAAMDAEVEELQQKVNTITKARQFSPASVSDDEHRAAVLALESARRRKEATWGHLPPAKAQAGVGGGAPAEKPPAQEMFLRQSVAAVASAEKLGDFYQYVIDHRVTLPRQKSALLPVVGKDVEGTRVSIYNEHTQPKFPLLGLKFKNTSGLHLMQGPVTLFEGSTYAGDARIPDLQPNEERLVSYAVDLGTEVNPVPHSDSGRLTHVKAVKGTLHTTTKLREKKTYTVKNRNPQDRLVLVEHPVRADFKLVDTAKPAETARDVYRFELKVPAGKTATLAVTEDHDVGSAVQLTNSPDEQVRVFLQSPVVSEKVKAGLKKAQELRWAWARTQADLGEQRRQLQEVAQDQGRLRANLREVPQSSPLHKRYLDKLEKQESEVEKYQAEIKRLQEQEHAQKKALDDFLAAFSAE